MCKKLIHKIKIWWNLRKAKKLEQVNVPSLKSLETELKQFMKESQGLKKEISKPAKNPAVKIKISKTKKQNIGKKSKKSGRR
ncbi:hypothetical protein J4434_08235 [Candidatus Woesearchaeota archaeon]|nr:hypothetical protein [Candidatus Woesearchaeota archaeon]